mgnify:CR=1 FL=1|jgi:hypothetical protein
MTRFLSKSCPSAASDDTPLGPARLLAPVEAWSPILATPHLLFSFLESAEEVGLVSDSL